MGGGTSPRLGGGGGGRGGGGWGVRVMFYSDSASSSTMLRMVPLPTSFAHREDWETAPHWTAAALPASFSATTARGAKMIELRAECFEDLCREPAVAAPLAELDEKRAEALRRFWLWTAA